MDESGLWHMLDADVVLGVLFGWLACPEGGGSDGIVVVALCHSTSLRTHAVPLQLLEKLSITYVNGLCTRQLSADACCSSFVTAQCERVAAIFCHVLKVYFGHAGRHRIEVGAFLHCELLRGQLLLTLQGRALTGTCERKRQGIKIKLYNTLNNTLQLKTQFLLL